MDNLSYQINYKKQPTLCSTVVSSCATYQETQEMALHTLTLLLEARERQTAVFCCELNFVFFMQLDVQLHSIKTTSYSCTPLQTCLSMSMQ